MKRFVLILSLLCVFAGQVFSQYYVDAASGNDSNSGRSPALAWRTVAKVNAAALLPGETVYFMRGQIWQEQLTVPSSGTAGNPITFSAFGTGANPIFDGGNTRYSTFDDNGKNYIILDGIDQRNTGGIVSQTHGNIAIHGQHNIVRNLSAYNSVRHALDIYTGAKYCLVENCLIYNAVSNTTSTVAIYGANAGTVDQDTIRNCTISNTRGSGGDGALINHGFTTNIVIEGCDMSGSASANVGQLIIDESGVSNTVIRRNKFHGRGGGAIRIDPTNTGSSSLKIHYNLFLLDSLDNSSVSSGIIVNSATGTQIYNNTFYGSNGQPAIRLSGSSTGTVIRNNIASAAYQFVNIAAAAQSGTTSDYNLVNGNWGVWGATTYTTLANWQSGSSQDAHSVSGDPVFTNAGQKDFTLQSTSPAIDRGTNVSLTRDYAGNPVPRGNAQDIGAFESPYTAVPVQLVFFGGFYDQIREAVVLRWNTISETNNYGFQVQKAASPAGEFLDVAGGFVRGHGTTIVPQQYEFVETPGPFEGIFYRLKQIDLDGTPHFSEAIQISTISGVGGQQSPTKFALEQNFPNPFNPATIIRYQVPRATHVSLKVFNLLGGEVATLVDAVTPAGFYAVTFDGSSLASGVYIFKLQAESYVDARKLLLLR